MREHLERTKQLFLISMVWLRGNAPKLAPGYVAQWLEWLTQILEKHASNTVWPSGLRRWLQAPVRKGVRSNPTAVTSRIAINNVQV